VGKWQGVNQVNRPETTARTGKLRAWCVTWARGKCDHVLLSRDSLVTWTTIWSRVYCFIFDSVDSFTTVDYGSLVGSCSVCLATINNFTPKITPPVLPYQCRRWKSAFLDNFLSKYSTVNSISVLSRRFVTTTKSLYPCIKKDRVQLTNQQTDQPTPLSRFLLETLAVSKLLKKLPALYTACTTLSCLLSARWIHSTPSHSIPLTYTLILSSPLH
jgi:hypothetical protein